MLEVPPTAMTLHLEVAKGIPMVLARITGRWKVDGCSYDCTQTTVLLLGQGGGSSDLKVTKANAPMGFHTGPHKACQLPWASIRLNCQYAAQASWAENMPCLHKKSKLSQPHPEVLTKVWKSSWDLNTLSAYCANLKCDPLAEICLALFVGCFLFSGSRGIMKSPSACRPGLLAEKLVTWP